MAFSSQLFLRIRLFFWCRSTLFLTSCSPFQVAGFFSRVEYFSGFVSQTAGFAGARSGRVVVSRWVPGRVEPLLAAAPFFSSRLPLHLDLGFEFFFFTVTVWLILLVDYRLYSLSFSCG